MHVLVLLNLKSFYMWRTPRSRGTSLVCVGLIKRGQRGTFTRRLVHFVHLRRCVVFWIKAYMVSQVLVVVHVRDLTALVPRLSWRSGLAHNAKNYWKYSMSPPAPWNAGGWFWGGLSSTADIAPTLYEGRHVLHVWHNTPRQYPNYLWA